MGFKNYNGRKWMGAVRTILNRQEEDSFRLPLAKKWSGYPEIQEPKIRYRLIDHSKRLKFLNANSHESLANTHRRWVESQLKTGLERQEHFSRSIAVGSKLFIQKVRNALGAQGIGRRMAKAPEMGHQLKETITKYGSGDSIQAGIGLSQMV
jgi:putative transposase